MADKCSDILAEYCVVQLVTRKLSSHEESTAIAKQMTHQPHCHEICFTYIYLKS